MRRVMVIGCLVAAFVVVAGLVAAATRQRISEPIRIHVIEHATTDTFVDTDGDGTDSTGDLLTFHNKVFNASNTEVVGRDQGECIRIDPARGTFECRYITYLGGGGVVVEGPFFERRDVSVLAVTGGTGRFQNARGQLFLRVLSPSEFDFVFELIP